MEGLKLSNLIILYLLKEGEEVRLKREITKAKDQYFLDGKVITKVQVAHTLQQAGLSKTNPYYIIRQGKV